MRFKADTIEERIDLRSFDPKADQRCYTKIPGISKYTLKTIFARKKRQGKGR